MKETNKKSPSAYVKILGVITRRGPRAVEVQQTGQTDLVVVPLAYSEISIGQNGGCVIDIRRDTASEIGFVL